jgi:hypothetical protein
MKSYSGVQIKIKAFLTLTIAAAEGPASTPVSSAVTGEGRGNQNQLDALDKNRISCRFSASNLYFWVFQPVSWPLCHLNYTGCALFSKTLANVAILLHLICKRYT